MCVTAVPSCMQVMLCLMLWVMRRYCRCAQGMMHFDIQTCICMATGASCTCVLLCLVPRVMGRKPESQQKADFAHLQPANKTDRLWLCILPVPFCFTMSCLCAVSYTQPWLLCNKYAMAALAFGHVHGCLPPCMKVMLCLKL